MALREKTGSNQVSTMDLLTLLPTRFQQTLCLFQIPQDDLDTSQQDMCPGDPLLPAHFLVQTDALQKQMARFNSITCSSGQVCERVVRLGYQRVEAKLLTRAHHLFQLLARLLLFSH